MFDYSMHQRWMRGLLTAVLLLTVLSGCSGSDDTPQQTTEDTQAAKGEGTHLSTDNIQKANDLIAQEMKDKNLPGVVVGVWTPDEGEYVTAQGTANLDTERSREPEDPFRIASITKTFTGTAILQLVDEGRLSKSDKLSTWYPDFPNADEITVDDLLRMRSGMVDPYASNDFLQDYYDNPEANITPEDMIEAATARADEFEPPDQKTKYNNLDFVLLGEIVGKVSGNDLGVQISQGIFEPLGMENSLYATNDQLPGELHGYSLDPKTNKFEDKTVLNPAVPGAAGAIISDISDMRTYSRALCTGDLLQPETQAARLEAEQMDGEPAFIQYGEGILQLGKFCGHNGTIFGFSSEMFYLPEEDAVILVNVNRLDVDDQSKSTDLFLAIAKTFFPEYVDW
ncbi:MAG: beta-lactamase family protein [Rubrobacter sp.]|nr:beta-lactamase family protein [Rubrobacter sp.]